MQQSTVAAQDGPIGAPYGDSMADA